ncbi:Qat anti-phage system associated protein QatB [Salinisphaera hydrothermalis]|uniref:Qat anti-phage system associated protein QatB n=1 Tax=Salinisphaera hydrothermalis TaxID=563188 RepID=UPI003341FBC7
MGTSQSSKGPGSGVPMVPSWADAPPLEAADGDDPSTAEGNDRDGDEDDQQAPSPIAPERRWLGVRRSLGNYGKTGDRGAMQRGVGRYVRDGYGGTRTAARRMAGTASTAGALGNALDILAGARTPDSRSAIDPALLGGRSADDIMDAVVEAVRPVDGTQDAEASREAIKDALTEMLTRFPDADLVGLSPEQREFAIERFVAHDVFRRFDLDVGQSIRENAPNATAGLARLRQARDYIKETVSAAFRSLREAGKNIISGRISAVVREALKETFEVFQGYAE